MAPLFSSLPLMCSYEAVVGYFIAWIYMLSSPCSNSLSIWGRLTLALATQPILTRLSIYTLGQAFGAGRRILLIG